MIHNRMLTWLLLCLVPSVSANQAQHYQDNVNWAQQAAGKIRDNDRYKTFSADSLCNDEACRQDIKNPAQSRYKSDPEAMDSAKAAAMASNDQAQVLTENFNEGRPTIDPNDPAYRRAVNVMNDAYNISHGISSKYHDCENGLSCDYNDFTRQCARETGNLVPCYLTPYVKSTSDTTGHRTYQIHGKEIRIPSPTKESEIVKITTPSALIVGHARGGRVKVALNGQTIGSVETKSCAPINGYLFYCEMKPKTFHLTTPITGSHLIIKLRTNNGKLKNPDMWRGPLTVYWRAKKLNLDWQNSCKTLIPECQPIKTTCIEGEATRELQGVPTTLSCWKQRRDYQCSFPDTCAMQNIENASTVSKAMYESAPAEPCQEQSTTCKTSVQGVCVENTVNLACQKQDCQVTNLVCGEESFCLDGDCYTPSGTQNDKFNQVASSLAAVSYAGKSIGDPPKIFTGKAMRCTKKAIGFSDCCKNSGWGGDLGLAKCNEEEKALAKAKKKKLTIGLGQYCAKKRLGVCLRKKKTYCVFDSKLARIVQEQGRRQLGLSFGSAKHPDCSAITPEQMQRIDFSQINFADFYEDLHSNMILPSSSQIQQRLEQAMKDNKS